jgi:vacuolar-type H+-ATPase subunit F/Vma7
MKPDTANKRTKVQVVEDREFICRHYLRGVHHIKISEMLTAQLNREYTLSRQQIEYDISVIVDTLKKSYEEKIGVYLFEQLRKIDELESEAWAAWEASKKSKQETVVMTKKAEQEGEKDRQEIIVKTTGQTGNVAYFEKVQWCIETRLRLLGFYRMNQYAKTLEFDGGPGNDDDDEGVVIYLPDNRRNDAYRPTSSK